MTSREPFSRAIARALPQGSISVPRCNYHSFHNDLVILSARQQYHLRRCLDRKVDRNDCRRAKTTAALEVKNLAQGAIRSDVKRPEPNVPTYPTVVLQARTNMNKYGNCVLLTRVGGFYELYFEHAEEFGPLLNLKVAQKKTSAGNVSMAGFPFFQLDRFLKILVIELNQFVAISEEFPNDASQRAKTGGLLHDRRVSRVITPGTLIDEDFIDPYASNYLLAVYADCQKDIKLVDLCLDIRQDLQKARLVTTQPPSIPVGLAWLDLSTGGFFTEITTLSKLISVVSRIKPSEVIVDARLQSSKDPSVVSTLQDDNLPITFCASDKYTTIMDWNPLLEIDVPVKTAQAFSTEEIAAGSVLLQYVQTRLQGSSVKLQTPQRYKSMQVMSIDRNSLRALEIRETIREGRIKGSLLHGVRRTVTRGGARLLNEWLASPSTSLKVIDFRLNLVGCMLQHSKLREKIVFQLKRSHDSQRLVQKFSMGRGSPDDLLALANTILSTREIVVALKGVEKVIKGSSKSQIDKCVKSMITRIQLADPIKLAKRIIDAVDEEGVVQQHRIDDVKADEMSAFAQEIVSSEDSLCDPSVGLKSGEKKKKKPIGLRDYYLNSNNDCWIMSKKASNTLQTLHEELQRLGIEKATLADRLQSRLGMPTLSLRWTPGLGHICHVRGKDSLTLSEMRSVSSSKSTRSFHHEEWTQLGQKLDQAHVRIRAAEHQVFLHLREQVVMNLVNLRRNATVLDELDIACSFAALAEEQALTRPILTDTSALKIVGGRHPTVELGLRERGRTFEPNDCFCGDQDRMWLITGPNMGGKSTFLRQNALIIIMAQVGSYVPAEYAEIGVVDQMFSRVGSADDLYQNQSTFMVEMLETARILKQATHRSFVIMDEIGRGTAPDDGVAVAFACVHHLHHVNRCRTLFATHFHSLADMSINMAGIGHYCTDTMEDESGAFIYMYKLRKGVNRDSQALKVATMAGLPDSAIRVARGVLQRMQGKDGNL